MARTGPQEASRERPPRSATALLLASLFLIVVAIVLGVRSCSGEGEALPASESGRSSPVAISSEARRALTRAAPSEEGAVEVGTPDDPGPAVIASVRVVARETGEGIGSVSLRVFDGRESAELGRTDAAGRFVLEGGTLPDGELLAAAAGYRTRTFRIADAGETTVELESAVELRGRLEVVGGGIASDVEIVAWRSNTVPRLAAFECADGAGVDGVLRGRSNARGEFALAGADPERSYTVTASGAGFVASGRRIWKAADDGNFTLSVRPAYLVLVDLGSTGDGRPVLSERLSSVKGISRGSLAEGRIRLQRGLSTPEFAILGILREVRPGFSRPMDSGLFRAARKVGVDDAEEARFAGWILGVDVDLDSVGPILIGLTSLTARSKTWEMRAPRLRAPYVPERISLDEEVGEVLEEVRIRFTGLPTIPVEFRGTVQAATSRPIGRLIFRDRASGSSFLCPIAAGEEELLLRGFPAGVYDVEFELARLAGEGGGQPSFRGEFDATRTDHLEVELDEPLGAVLIGLPDLQGRSLVAQRFGGDRWLPGSGVVGRAGHFAMPALALGRYRIIMEPRGLGPGRQIGDFLVAEFDVDRPGELLVLEATAFHPPR
ncbi:MAG: hypothetical protein R3F20_08980 [Planctomycetota bacterium]